MAPRKPAKKQGPAANERIEHLEKGMTQLSTGITSILDRMEEDKKDREAERLANLEYAEGKKAEPEQLEEEKPKVEAPPSTISIGEIFLRRDLFEYMERVVAYQDSTSRPGWTIEDEINMLIKHSKKNSETSQAAQASREETISGDKK